MTEPFAAYLRELREIRSSGSAVKETSYYGPLANLFNAVGKTLKPRVRCVINIQSRGAGIPDGGLFTSDQLQRAGDTPMLSGQVPARGVFEVKGTREEVDEIADSLQVIKYWERYGQVLVTNYRDFRLIGRTADGQRVPLESFRLAPDETAFWAAVTHPERMIEEQGERFVEYLKRVMLHAAPLSAPADVAWFLASYARDARARVEQKTRTLGGDLKALEVVRNALEQALGIQFKDSKGEHFFRSTLIQTLFYGVFSAWVLWSKKHPYTDRTARFHWREAAWSLRVPMIRALFEQVATPSKLGALDLVEVLDWTEAALNRVVRESFFARFEADYAVQYFYEPFLQAFDPELRKDLGVWYTPPEVVRYMVARVDTALREELDIPDGLADPRIHILDPCCGTGAYLVEVVKRIAATLAEQGGDALMGDDLKRAVLERIHGFELLPAPFVVAHLQMGLQLQNLGAPLAEGTDERVGVYLTNALTGWETPKGPKQKLISPELEDERDAAEKVKLKEPILVIIGNPPYNGFGGVAIEEERSLTNAYRTTKRAPAPQGRGLNDLYLRFFRMAERYIVERGGKGVVCYISNYSWLDGLSYTGMREHYLEVFDQIWVDCLNGDKFKTGKLTPEGHPDPSIFSTKSNREGIQVGTAIALMVKKGEPSSEASIHFRNLWGVGKIEELILNASDKKTIAYQPLNPVVELGLPLTPVISEPSYFKWPIVPELLPISIPGVFTARDDFVVDIDKARLTERILAYFDYNVSNEEMKRLYPSSMSGTSRFDPIKTRDYLRKRGFQANRIVRYMYRPFDTRWLYWENETKLLDEKRPEYAPHVNTSNRWLAAVRQNRKAFDPPMITSSASSLHLIERGANMFPASLAVVSQDASLFDTYPAEIEQRNLSEAAVRYIKSITNQTGKENLYIFFHICAVLYAPAFRADHADSLKKDWPRIPLPNESPTLNASIVLGSRMADLLDTENRVVGVTAPPLRLEVKVFGIVASVAGTLLGAKPDDLALTVGWGSFGQGKAVMPGKGKVVRREYEADEVEAIRRGAADLGLTGDEAIGLLGPTTLDVYLNGVAYWKNVPEKVWTYTIGGYQVIKKWLSYRERTILGRPLRTEEAREVRDMVRRIAALILMGPELDRNYAAALAGLFDWSSLTKDQPAP